MQGELPQERIFSRMRCAIRASAAFVGLVVMVSVVSALGQAQNVVAKHATYRVLYRFTGGADGGNPFAGLLRDSLGNLYGTTFYGGDTGCVCGTVFRINKKGTKKSRETVLFAFTGDQDLGGPDGNWPQGDLVQDSAGNLYGTATGGGAFDVYGVVFKLDTSGMETVLHSFNGPDGNMPQGLIRDTKGNLYGVTPWAGVNNCGGFGCGVAYKMDPSGNETVLYRFNGGSDGEWPYGDLVQDAQGNLYGTTAFGGDSGKGVVFMIDKTGKQTVLHTFTGGTMDGANPYAGLIADSSGNLYGTTIAGGTSNSGTIFKIDQGGAETVLYSFTGGSDGAMPYGALVRDAGGNFYGTTTYGGDLGCIISQGCGVVYEFDNTGKETVLHKFKGKDGAWPYFGHLVLDEGGHLYGTASASGNGLGFGVVYELTP